MSKTLFLIGDDLSENIEGVNRTTKARNFDVYTMLDNPNIKIKHETRRGPSELVEEDPINGNIYLAGVAYDVFNVWVDCDHGSSCVAENVLTFGEALNIAKQNLKLS